MSLRAGFSTRKLANPGRILVIFFDSADAIVQRVNVGIVPKCWLGLEPRALHTTFFGATPSNGKNAFHHQSSVLYQSRGSVDFNWNGGVTNMDQNGNACGVAATAGLYELVVASRASNDGGYEQNFF